MAKKKASLSSFQVKKPDGDPVVPETPAPDVKAPKRKLKGFYIRPEAIAQFDLLVAEQKVAAGKRGTHLIAEALNLLFEQYGKPPIA